VDDKGRLNVPAKLTAYLTGLQATTVFVTSIDRKSAKIYPLPAWAANKKKLVEASGTARKAAQHVLTVAQHLGEDVEVKAGRITLPTEMRRLLKMESCHVFLDAGEGVLTVYMEEVFAARLVEATEDYEAKLEMVEELGLT